MTETTLSKLQSIFREVLDDDQLSLAAETTAEEVPAWDSLSHLTLVAEIEKEFGIKFALGELQTLKNVGDMVDLVNAKSG